MCISRSQRSQMRVLSGASSRPQRAHPSDHGTRPNNACVYIHGTGEAAGKVNEQSVSSNMVAYGVTHKLLNECRIYMVRSKETPTHTLYSRVKKQQYLTTMIRTERSEAGNAHTKLKPKERSNSRGKTYRRAPTRAAKRPRCRHIRTRTIADHKRPFVERSAPVCVARSGPRSPRPNPRRRPPMEEWNSRGQRS